MRKKKSSAVPFLLSLIHIYLHTDLSDSDRMNDIRLTVAALLSLMCLGRTFVCRANLLDIRLRVLFLYEMCIRDRSAAVSSISRQSVSRYGSMSLPDCAVVADTNEQ